MKKFLVLGIALLVILFFISYQKYHSFETETQVFAQSTTSDWPQLQRDSHHSGYSPISVVPGYKVSWAFFDKDHVVRNFVSAPNNSIHSGFPSSYSVPARFSELMQPIAAAGKAYFGDLSGTFHAVDLATGSEMWSFKANGPIISTAAYSNGIVIVPSLDGNLYGLNATNGAKTWQFSAGAGFFAAPVIFSDTVYAGSLDGNLYALGVSNGARKWQYTPRVNPSNSNSPHNQAPIMAPAAVSPDGQTVVFGAENMFFYGLNAANGAEKWAPKKMVGQSFMLTWPVITDNKAIVRTMSSLPGAEYVMESVLDALPDNPTWAQEKAAILNWLSQNPNQKTMYVIDLNSGSEPYQVAMGRVTGNNFPPFPPALDSQNRPLLYWRVRNATFFKLGQTFGTKYCPDFSAMNTTTGDRITIPNSSSVGFCPELDNGFQPSVGGNYVYFQNHFRGVRTMNLSTGAYTFVSAQYAKGDCADYRGWGAQIIYTGNDSQDSCTKTVVGVPAATANTTGFISPAITSYNGTNILLVNEGDVGAIVAIVTK